MPYCGNFKNVNLAFISVRFIVGFILLVSEFNFWLLLYIVKLLYHVGQFFFRIFLLTWYTQTKRIQVKKYKLVRSLWHMLLESGFCKQLRLMSLNYLTKIKQRKWRGLYIFLNRKLFLRLIVFYQYKTALYIWVVVDPSTLSLSLAGADDEDRIKHVARHSLKVPRFISSV